VIVEEILNATTLWDIIIRSEANSSLIKKIINSMPGLAIEMDRLSSPPYNLVNRDIKPLNLLFDGNKVMLVDFGLARLDEDSQNILRLGGTPLYYPPEFIRGYLPNDLRVDQFSLGMSIAEMSIQEAHIGILQL
jgi:eukaryotic-like serine/threonine-protein kinase